MLGEGSRARRPLGDHPVSKTQDTCRTGKTQGQKDQSLLKVTGGVEIRQGQTKGTGALWVVTVV